MSSQNELKQISERLQKAMSNSNLSYGDIAKKTNIPKSAIHRYISGKTPKIPLDRLKELAKALGVSAAWVMGWENENESKEKSNIDNLETNEPISFSYNNFILDCFIKSLDGVAKFDEATARTMFNIFEVKDDKMYPHYKCGDRIIIRNKEQFEHSGKVALVIYKNETSLKRVEFNDEKTRYKLSCTANNIPPIIIENDNLSELKIIGEPWFVVRDEKLLTP